MKTALALIAVAVLALTAILTTSCSTAAGLGRDIQTMGRGIEKAAR